MGSSCLFARRSGKSGHLAGEASRTPESAVRGAPLTGVSREAVGRLARQGRIEFGPPLRLVRADAAWPLGSDKLPRHRCVPALPPEAVARIPEACLTINAQVAHITLYVQMLDKFVRLMVSTSAGATGGASSPRTRCRQVTPPRPWVRCPCAHVGPSGPHTCTTDAPAADQPPRLTTSPRRRAGSRPGPSACLCICARICGDPRTSLCPVWAGR